MRLLLGLVALALVVGLIAVGQLLSAVTDGHLGLTAEYIHSLASEIGGSGIDAVLVGTVAGAVLSSLQDRRRLAGHRETLRRRIARGTRISLRDATAEWSARLDLRGASLMAEEIEDRSFHRVAFALDGTPVGELDHMHFAHCTFSRCDFSGGGAGFRIQGSTFSSTWLRSCDFRGAVIEAEGPAPVFERCMVRRCRFDNARLRDVRLDTTDLTGCSFWGATFTNCRVPEALHDQLRALGAIVPGEAGVWHVVSRREFFRRPTAARLRYALGRVFAGRGSAETRSFHLARDKA